MAALAITFAMRELRAGLRGFRIFVACIALGVAAIAAAGSTAEAFRQGLAAQSREIFGGDLAVTVQQAPFTAAQTTALQNTGKVSYALALEAMAQAPSGARRVVELRGVSALYPLVGRVDLAGAADLAQALTPTDGVAGAAVEKSLLDRLGLRLGDRFMVGNITLVAKAVLLAEPDRLSRGFALGPRVLTDLLVVQQAGFVQAGLPFAETARIALPAGTSLAQGKMNLISALGGAPAAEGYRLRDRSDATPGLSRMIDQLEYFLGFIGLASLVAGGLGVYGAVSAYLQTRKPSIAVLKALGAPGALIRDTYLIQIGALAVVGVGIGLAVGAAAPLILGALVHDSLPIPALFALYPQPLAKAAAFGLLAAAAFSLLPLGQARATSPAALFRQDRGARPGLGLESLGAALAGAALAGLAIATAPTPLAAVVMIAGVGLAFAGLWFLGLLAAWGAGRSRLATRGALRMALGNLAGPASAARTAAPAIGLGVALLSAVVLIQSSLLTQVQVVAPKTAPSLVFTGVPGARAAAFDAAVADAFGHPLDAEHYLRAPFVTGRIIGVRGLPLDLEKIDPAARWAYDNDITLSVLGPQPRDAGIVAGRWWPQDYRGPPLIAVSVDAAKGADLKVGDRITLAVLGREIDARVAVLRKIDFGGFGAGFPLVLDPAALAGADLAQVAIAKATRAEERRTLTALGRSFPMVNVISVREQLEAASDLFARLSLAIRAAGGVAAMAGLLVLTGAIAAGARARAREAATLKVLGAVSGQILAMYVIEYAAVGAIAGLAGVMLGYAAAWPVVVNVFQAHWSVDWSGIVALVGGSCGLAALGGLWAAALALRQRPAPVLRAPD